MFGTVGCQVLQAPFTLVNNENFTQVLSMVWSIYARPFRLISPELTRPKAELKAGQPVFFPLKVIHPQTSTNVDVTFNIESFAGDGMVS